MSGFGYVMLVGVSMIFGKAFVGVFAEVGTILGQWRECKPSQAGEDAV